ncbi:FAD-dependent oxidoreductase [Aspergillus lucknowensis]|uniref:FAD-binding domain-containing protein n=1 Tax=Aspergillus lucknowensis TaxID=176173 RepID=A0ABR4LFJ7_9EURO
MREFSENIRTVQSLVKSTNKDLKAWQLYNMDHLPRWVSRHAALIGDAAHPFQPFLGQGGAMAIKDGGSLAAFLPLGTAPGEIPGRLELYEKARWSKVEMSLKYTRINAGDEDGSSERRVTGELKHRMREK